MSTTQLTRDELHITKQVMRAYGGGFVNALVDLLDVADGNNTAKALAAWPEVFEAYGPGSQFYAAFKQD